ncbi:hypothetical protein CEXT_26451 [Caerostris extrusa]|uniref:Ribosomal protein S13 n=1 Tax=Caerostris extrusa TaxID=172846 RepID=A0AAV4VZ15_CAEEX|nr:hypothetical protein CEXT_26451 [Caerostris extrusa]
MRIIPGETLTNLFLQHKKDAGHQICNIIQFPDHLSHKLKHSRSIKKKRGAITQQNGTIHNTLYSESRIDVIVPQQFAENYSLIKATHNRQRSDRRIFRRPHNLQQYHYGTGRVVVSIAGRPTTRHRNRNRKGRKTER